MLLPIKTVEKPWGRDVLPTPFAPAAGDISRNPAGGGAAARRIGEIWFEPPVAMPELLIKYLFTSDKLSVQCHPSDAQTQAMGLGRQGKEECWLVLDAEPGAVLGIGFNRHVGREEMRAAALDGSIEDLLTWHQVRKGEFFYIPANTVHAIGGGCSIIEIQQNSDITYRLYDYGRPRELHLDEGIAVALGEPFDERCHQQLPEHGSVTLVDGPYFRLDHIDGLPAASLAARYVGPLLVVPEEGEVELDSGEQVRPGDCALAPSLGAIRFAREGRCLIVQPIG